MRIVDRIQHAWNAFRNDEQRITVPMSYGPSYTTPLHRASHRTFSRSKFAQTVFNRIALDVAMTKFEYVQVDEKTKKRKPQKDTGIYRILTEEANIDQTHIQFIHDLVFSMFDEGVVAAVPVDTDLNPNVTMGFDIKTIRIGKVLEWYPRHVKVHLYDERVGRYKDVIVEKRTTAIIENPLYAVINGPGSPLSRLMSKMHLVDDMDRLLASGRLDLIIQLPYPVKNSSKQRAAQERIDSIETHLNMGNNGIAYIDSSEKVIQLNRAANGQASENAKMLKEEFYNHLGLTQAVLDGTATEAQMRIYYNRSIDPIINSIIAEFNRKFLSRTARTKGYEFIAMRDTFDLVPVQTIAELGDTLRRNQIATPNEIRRLLGFEPLEEEMADSLLNPNMPVKDQLRTAIRPGSDTSPEEIQNGVNNAKEEVDEV